MFIRFASVLGVLVCWALTASARAEGLKEGQWSTTMVTKMNNASPEMAEAMQQMQNLPPEAQAMMKQRGIQLSGNGQGTTVTVTQCITKDNPVPKQNPDDQNCQQTHDTNGNTVNYHVTCNENDGQMDATGSMTYDGDSMQGHSQNHMVQNGQAIDSTMDITGKYLGPCPPAGQ